MTARITVNPNIHFGKPCVAGTRIPVQNVLELVREGIPFEKIIEDYYHGLQMEDVRSCVHYAIGRGIPKEFSYGDRVQSQLPRRLYPDAPKRTLTNGRCVGDKE